MTESRQHQVELANMAGIIERLAGKLALGEEPLNDGRVVDRGDALHPSGTARTAQDVQVERNGSRNAIGRGEAKRPRPKTL